MKSKVVISLFVFLLSAAQFSARRVEFGDFHRILSKHGNWVEIRNVGLVWAPIDIYRGWEPYTNGRWYWTEFGWFWDSEDPFGWVTHHYGRWDYDDWYGWVWHPGYEWAPAWVKWRISGDYIGWRPLTPKASFNHSTGISYQRSRSLNFSRWNFVKVNKLNKHSILQHLVRSNRTADIYKYSEPISDYYVFNDVVYCGTFLPDTRFSRIKNDIHIVNLHYTNDFDRINEFGFDYWLDIPRKPSPPSGPGFPEPCPYPGPRPRPHPRPKILPVVINPIPSRPPDIRNTPSQPEYRDPIPDRPIKGIPIKNIIIINNEIKKEKRVEVKKNRKIKKERKLVTKNNSR